MHSIFILGAGFSKPAGLPLANELLARVVNLMRQGRPELYKNVLEPDILRYLEFRRLTDGKDECLDTLNLEQFISFLDMQHTLGLEGSDHWSGEGNRSQLALRNYIARVLFEAQSQMTLTQKSLYDNFVDHLGQGDIVFTLNYDTIVEDALERRGKDYRLFPLRYKSVGKHYSIVDNTQDEIVVIKLHGSIDWFFIPEFEKQGGREDHEQHVVYKNSRRLGVTPIIDRGPYDESSSLRSIYKARTLQPYFRCAESLFQAPLIVAPSYSKEHYLQPLLEFFWGLNQTGGGALGLSVIGFSLAPPDQHLVQAVYSIVRNFQSFDHGRLATKAHLKFVDYQTSINGRRNFRRRYRFADWKKCKAYWDGFGPEAIRFLFQQTGQWH